MFASEVFLEFCKNGLRNGPTLKEIILRRHIGNLHGLVKLENSKLEKPATLAPKYSSNKEIKVEISEKSGSDLICDCLNFFGQPTTD